MKRYRIKWEKVTIRNKEVTKTPNIAVVEDELEALAIKSNIDSDPDLELLSYEELG